ncbi:MAG TPA: phosphate/phosphite/phosphonate ABC transporter substrate-binding protein [Candidatus Ozemobacteraceae bacterium]|nr:phosphate/phosphite/phosphonate ABC transporter substrate-binding protein [Candidatus Ozemobacteraceae bacterium]
MKPIFWTVILALFATAGFWAYQPKMNLIPVKLRIDPNPPLVFGVIPFLGPRELKARMEPLLTHLSRKLGRPVKLNVSTDYETLSRLMDDGRVEIAWFSHASYQHLGFGKPWKIICRPVQNGRIDYFGKIIVRADSPFRTIEDLKGHAFAYVERNSGSGFYFPNELFKSMGIEPLNFFGRIIFTHSHDSSIDGVVKGLYDGAAVYTIAPNRENASTAALLRYVATTGPIPNDPLVARGDLPPELASAVRNALLTMHLDPAAREDLAQLAEWRGISRFAAEDEVQKILAGPQASASIAPLPALLPDSLSSETPHE